MDRPAGGSTGGIGAVGQKFHDPAAKLDGNEPLMPTHDPQHAADSRIRPGAACPCPVALRVDDTIGGTVTDRAAAERVRDDQFPRDERLEPVP